MPKRAKRARNLEEQNDPRNIPGKQPVVQPPSALPSSAPAYHFPQPPQNPAYVSPQQPGQYGKYIEVLLRTFNFPQDVVDATRQKLMSEYPGEELDEEDLTMRAVEIATDIQSQQAAIQENKFDPVMDEATESSRQTHALEKKRREQEEQKLLVACDLLREKSLRDSRILRGLRDDRCFQLVSTRTINCVQPEAQEAASSSSSSSACLNPDGAGSSTAVHGAGGCQSAAPPHTHAAALTLEETAIVTKFKVTFINLLKLEKDTQNWYKEHAAAYIEERSELLGFVFENHDYGKREWENSAEASRSSHDGHAPVRT
jgi:hypothetical protein